MTNHQFNYLLAAFGFSDGERAFLRTLPRAYVVSIMEDAFLCRHVLLSGMVSHVLWVCRHGFPRSAPIFTSDDWRDAILTLRREIDELESN